MTDTAEKTRIFIVAGEASGDTLGAKLLESLHYIADGQLDIRGIGGDKMAEQGLASIFPMRDIALMGFAEILPHAWRLLCRVKQACDAAVEFRPDIVVTIDSPGFTFRLVKWLRRCFGDDIKYVHYVAPTVWAYKPERAAKTAALFDHLLTLLPFEPPYFEEHGLPTTFIGHPVTDDLGRDYVAPRCYNGGPLRICLFPGSRRGEVQKLMPILRDAITIIAQDYPDIDCQIILTPMVMPYITIKDWPIMPTLAVGDESRNALMQQAHVALTKTGTVTLEIAKHGLPMVATYKIHRISAAILRRLLTLPYVNLLNIIAECEVIPEYMQERCEPQLLADAVISLVQDYASAQQQNNNAMHALESMRNPRELMASDDAASIILSYRP